MAFTGANDYRQVIRIADFHWFRGRSCFTVVAWVRIVSYSSWRPFWRQDGVFTPVQIIGSEAVVGTPIWAPTLKNISGPLVHYGNIPVATWAFCAFLFRSSRGSEAYRYTETGGLFESPNMPLDPGSSAVVSDPSPIKPMVLGGTETNDDTILAGEAIAECAVFPGAVSPRSVVQMAHDLSAFRRDMAFYLPLRDAGRTTTEPVGRGRQYALQYGDLSRSLILPEDHPPVERMRTGTRVFMSSVGFERLRFSDGLTARPTLPNAVLRVGLA